MELVGHCVATGRPQQSEDFLLDTHRARTVEVETSSPEFRTVFDDQSSVLNEVGSLEMPHDTHSVPKFDVFAQNHHAEVVLATISAFVVFLLMMMVYLTYQHSCAPSYPMKGDVVKSPLDHTGIPKGK